MRHLAGWRKKTCPGYRLEVRGGKVVAEFVCEVHDHAGGRLCRGSTQDRQRQRQRARSHALIYGHAVRVGLQGTPEMQHFARALFLLSRQCGAAGLGVESRRLFELSRQASGEARSRGLDYSLYKMAVSLLGWTMTGRLGGCLDRLRK